MIDLPLRRILISDFRRLEGHRILPLDAQVVLLHGPNGTGKTSVLSALELALTGEIRSMRRHDERYTAHLPFHEQEFATVRVDVSETLAANRESTPMTVGGSRIDGAPALRPDAAQFFAERCYLDQVSLGQLLELYQYREGSEESALARFVNELLGLEQLDALRSGLADAVDWRRLKKLSEPLAETDSQLEAADRELVIATKDLEIERIKLEHVQKRLREALTTLGFETPASSDSGLRQSVLMLLESLDFEGDHALSLQLDRDLIALGGRIEGLVNRPVVTRLEQAEALWKTAKTRHERWLEESMPIINNWRADAATLGLDLSGLGDEVDFLDEKIHRISQRLQQQEDLLARRSLLQEQLASRDEELVHVEARLSQAQERAGSLAEGLASLRESVTSDVCPVCDRDFSEVSEIHLSTHMERRIAALTNHGVELRRLREQRSALIDELSRDHGKVDQLLSRMLPNTELADHAIRRSALGSLRERRLGLDSVLRMGRELEEGVNRAKEQLDEAEAFVGEGQNVRTEFSRLALALGLASIDSSRPVQESLRSLSEAAAERVALAEERRQIHLLARESLEDVVRSLERVAELRSEVAESAEKKVKWEHRHKEAKRRQGVARAVHAAAGSARTAIVQRVFTQSLNDVWRSLFTRLAPAEPFIPAFGIPKTSKTALELTLGTVQRSGELGGSPQMMLSSGNLNTAALSLFIALHLAVEPLVPCLIFDDPVQAMDEVHVAQFAGLIRVLAKHHDRQIVIAVHERELFEYLALELSPAFQGDELLTIELGGGPDRQGETVNRVVWSPDSAIAG